MGLVKQSVYSERVIRMQLVANARLIMTLGPVPRLVFVIMPYSGVHLYDASVEGLLEGGDRPRHGAQFGPECTDHGCGDFFLRAPKVWSDLQTPQNARSVAEPAQKCSLVDLCDDGHAVGVQQGSDAIR
jgi:hypothetical protein